MLLWPSPALLAVEVAASSQASSVLYDEVANPAPRAPPHQNNN
ncbi:hypothetical protein [Mycolicibacterium komossense]|nr:hypothetical protein [Mycolicibacterium komossense]